MTPEQALNLLDRVCSKIPASREDHVNIQQAVTILAEAIKPKEE